jgi:hypothetical protein
VELKSADAAAVLEQVREQRPASKRDSDRERVEARRQRRLQRLDLNVSW